MDLCCCAGGWSHGFQQEGYGIVAGVDNDKQALATFKLNIPSADKELADLMNKKDRDLLVDAYKGKVTIGLGGSPCTGFSKAHPTDGNKPTRRLLPICVKLYIEIGVDVIFMENAEQAKKSPEMREAISALETAGYSVQCKVVCAADYGVPQNRKRTILVATRNGWTFTWPSKHDRHVTLGEALAQSPIPAQGEKVTDAALDRIEGRSAPYGSSGRICTLDNPAKTLMTQKANTVILRGDTHYQPSIEEFMRIQTFPPTFAFPPSVPEGERYKMIGNAVPPMMAAAMASGLTKGTTTAQTHSTLDRPNPTDPSTDCIAAATRLQAVIRGRLCRRTQPLAAPDPIPEHTEASRGMLEACSATTFPSPDKKGPCWKKGGDNPTRSTINFGLSRAYHKKHEPLKESPNNAKYADLYNVCKGSFEAAFPGVTCNAFLVNKNACRKRHAHHKNVGISYLMTVGNFTRGALRVYNPDGTHTDLDAHNRWVEFDGRLNHETCPWLGGDRYAIIFFNVPDQPPPTDCTTYTSTEPMDVESIDTAASDAAGEPPLVIETDGLDRPELGTASGLAAVSGSVPTQVKIALEREPGTILKVKGLVKGKPEMTYLGEVVGVEADEIIVSYRDGKEKIRHDFDADGRDSCGCSYVVVEPPMYKLSMLRRTEGGYEGKLTPGDGVVWQLGKSRVEQHYRNAGETVWLKETLGASFLHVPDGKKVKKAATKKNDCALGSVAKMNDYRGDTMAADAAREAVDESLKAKDRLKFATAVMGKCNYESRKVKVGCAMLIDPNIPALVTLKSVDGTCRSHAVTVYRRLIFDAAESSPLPLTVENLSHCLGVPYGGIVRGYAFVPQPKALERLHVAEREEVARQVDRLQDRLKDLWILKESNIPRLAAAVEKAESLTLAVRTSTDHGFAMKAAETAIGHALAVCFYECEAAVDDTHAFYEEVVVKEYKPGLSNFTSRKSLTVA
jgi:site-specific DNA-cytosine methylase